DDVRDQTAEIALGRRRVDETADRVHSEQLQLQAASKRVGDQATHLSERLADLELQVDSASGAGISVLDVAYTDGDKKASEESDRKNEQALGELADTVSAGEARKVALAAELAAQREAFALQQQEVTQLEREEEAAEAAAAAMDAKRRADASKGTEALVGVSNMSEAQLDLAVEQEETEVRKNSDIGEWYRATVANLEQIGGFRISHRLLFGTAGGGGVEGLELMVDLGSDQIMEVTVSSADGGLRSAHLCPPQNNAVMGGLITPSELEELKGTADAVPAPGNLRMLIREAMSRARCAALRDEHVRLMRRRYLVGYRAPSREVTITMPVGIVASFRLHADYPRVAGGAEVLALTGVGGWSASETEAVCRRVNDLALATLMEAMDHIEEALVALEEGMV
ncbi:unnamed protein product, partial [Laminaria digitata]